MGEDKKALPGEQGSSREKVGPGNPPVATRFKPGQSGNPSGQRKGGLSLTKLVREALEKSEIRTKGKNGKISVKKLPDGLTVADLLADVIVKQALGGHFQFTKEAWDRIDGKTEEPEGNADDFNMDISANDPAPKTTPRTT